MPLFSGFSLLILPMGFNHSLHIKSVFQQFGPHSGYLLFIAITLVKFNFLQHTDYMLLKASTSYSLSRFLYVWVAAIVGAIFFAST
ncbi:hypothetical protein EUGRSUZ_A00284 [Eucalyptus grandis]|uniref:Uncharacterized protein n=2 Tax=Eucalyptus grandis TaxID=71139 RepID=A0ACC3LYY7_EUCGR|nr:hypothetical protein EUGRSUZ_A00284 [Eucalyptus grandis]